MIQYVFGYVEVPVEEFTNYEQPTKYIVKNTDYKNEYDIPVLTAGQTFILGYTNENDGIYNASKDNPVIIFDDFTGAFKWVNFPFKVKSSAVKMITTNNNVLLKYLYYLMGKINFISDEHKRLWISYYSQLNVLIPPIDEQKQIVDILDKFDNLCNDSTQGLQLEIQQRQKQYEYYRDKLLNFK